MVPNSFADHLFKSLEHHGVEYVFGIPGVHTAELYRSLASTPIRHITPRHEQGAGFMADGYARITGRPGICMVITGPGLSNIATAMLQAHADSIPMLVFAGSNNPASHPLGRLHEMPDQSAFGAQIAAFSRRVDNSEQLCDAIEDAFTLFKYGRPGPVLLEIPLDVMHQKGSADNVPRGTVGDPSKPSDTPDLNALAQALSGAENSVLIIGGGARHAAAEVLNLAERLDAPVVTTINASSCLPAGHPLVVRASPSMAPIRSLIDQADFVLAIGTELGPTDFDVYNDGETFAPKRLARIDIDPRVVERSIRAEYEIICDAKRALSSLLDQVPKKEDTDGGEARTAAANHAAYEALSPVYRGYVKILQQIQETLPGVAMVGDSTQLVYAGNLFYPPGADGHWFNSSVGFGTLGYALPAAIGAKLAEPGRPVVALIGDGGMQFTLPELGTLRDLGLPVIVLIWNNDGYGEISTFMEDRGIVPEGVNVAPPKYNLIAEAYDLDFIRLDAARLEVELAGALKDANSAMRSTLIEVMDR